MKIRETEKTYCFGIVSLYAIQQIFFAFVLIQFFTLLDFFSLLTRFYINVLFIQFHFSFRSFFFWRKKEGERKYIYEKKKKKQIYLKLHECAYVWICVLCVCNEYVDSAPNWITREYLCVIFRLFLIPYSMGFFLSLSLSSCYYFFFVRSFVQ